MIAASLLWTANVVRTASRLGRRTASSRGDRNDTRDPVPCSTSSSSSTPSCISRCARRQKPWEDVAPWLCYMLLEISATDLPVSWRAGDAARRETTAGGSHVSRAYGKRFMLRLDEPTREALEDLSKHFIGRLLRSSDNYSPRRLRRHSQRVGIGRSESTDGRETHDSCAMAYHHGGAWPCNRDGGRCGRDRLCLHYLAGLG
jgi:hypothetical protein